MANSKDFNEGYLAAIEALRKIKNGESSNGSGSSNQDKMKGTDGQPMGNPELNGKDKKQAEKMANGNSQASIGARAEAAKNGNSCGGMLSQESGAEIAKSEGYSKDDCDVQSGSQISNEWQNAVINACNNSNSPGMGNMISHIKSYYMTSHDWKGELRTYIGRALSRINMDTKLGKKKWLARGEVKKFEKPSEHDLSDVIFMIDCSGSISDLLLQNLISECYTICKRKNISRVTYCYYEDGIQQVDTNDTLKFDGIVDEKMISKMKRGTAAPSSDIHGRGGNDESKSMKELEEIIKNSHKHPELVMWFTDGYCASAPPKPSSVRHMIWVVYRNDDFKASDDSRVIHIKPEDLGK